jgi:uncharacterized protein
MILIDTSAWYAVEVEDDENHSAAINFFKKRVASSLHGSPVTTDYILDETLTLLRMRRGIRVAAQFSDKIQNTKSLRILWIGDEIFSQALKLFKQSDERQEWSFTDCTSFSIMNGVGISESFTFDEHFASAGFAVLPNMA